jgi:hypothetical protein
MAVGSDESSAELVSSHAEGAQRANGSTPSERRKARRVLVALAGIIGVFVVLSAVVAVKTPAWESNDEPAHVKNIEAIAAGHLYGMHLGHPHIVVFYGQRVNVTPSASGSEAHQAPLYYALLAGWQRSVDVPVRTPDPGVDSVFESHGRFLHHKATDHQFLMWLRLPNIFLGTLTILFTFLAARQVTEDAWTPLVAAAIIGVLPRFVFLSAFVTNDNLANALGAVLAFLVLRYVNRPTWWRMAQVGMTVGALIITKLSTLPLVAVIVILALTRPDWRQRTRMIVLGIGTAALVSGWYMIQNMVRYGSPLAGRASEEYLSKVSGLGTPYGVEYRVSDPIRHIFFDVPERFLQVFWYGSGWTEIFRWPWPVGLVFWLALAATLVGLAHSTVSSQVLLPLAVVAVSGFLSLWIVSFQTATYDPRLALVGMPALACLAALGVQRLRPGMRWFLPLLCLGGTLFAVQTNVLAVRWS